jgi:antitoxin CptB
MDDEYRRMCWASRRGMLELDLILEPFVREEYPSLDPSDRERYRRLMGCQDQELFTWFLSREMPEDAELVAIVDRILAFTRAAGGGRATGD